MLVTLIIIERLVISMMIKHLVHEVIVMYVCFILSSIEEAVLKVLKESFTNHIILFDLKN